MKIVEMLENHRKLSIQLKEVKDKEMELRINIVNELAKLKGVGTYKFDEFEEDGLSVKIVKKLTYSIDQKAIDLDKLTNEEQDCLRWKADLNLTSYKMTETPNLDDLVTVKDAAPTLKVELLS